MTMRSMKSMMGQPVLAIDNAEEIGRVKHFVVSTDVSRIERLHIDGRNKKALFARWEDLESFGNDRVMLSQADAPSTSEASRDIDAARGDVELLGARILDTAGFERGTVADATFDADSGSVTTVTTSDGIDIDAAQVRSLGSYALVVDAAG